MMSIQNSKKPVFAAVLFGAGFDMVSGIRVVFNENVTRRSYQYELEGQKDEPNSDQKLLSIIQETDVAKLSEVSSGRSLSDEKPKPASDHHLGFFRMPERFSSNFLTDTKGEVCEDEDFAILGGKLLSKVTEDGQLYYKATLEFQCTYSAEPYDDDVFFLIPADVVQKVDDPKKVFVNYQPEDNASENQDKQKTQAALKNVSEAVAKSTGWIERIQNDLNELQEELSKNGHIKNKDKATSIVAMCDQIDNELRQNQQNVELAKTVDSYAQTMKSQQYWEETVNKVLGKFASITKSCESMRKVAKQFLQQHGQAQQVRSQRIGSLQRTPSGSISF